MLRCSEISFRRSPSDAQVAHPPPVTLIRVALDLPLHRCFDYLAPAATSDDIGRCVRVPFGRRSVIGVIVDLPASSDFAAEQLKPVEAILATRAAQTPPRCTRSNSSTRPVTPSFS